MDKEWISLDLPQAAPSGNTQTWQQLKSFSNDNSRAVPTMTVPWQGLFVHEWIITDPELLHTQLGAAGTNWWWEGNIILNGKVRRALQPVSHLQPGSYVPTKLVG